MHIRYHLFQMKKSRRHLFIGFITLLALTSFLTVLTNVHGKEKKEQKRVLFISSYNESFESVPEQIKGISEVLLPKDILLDIEYMDTKRFDTEEILQIFYQALKYKLSMSEPYDGIIVGDDAALNFVMSHKEEFFPNLPIVFLGVNDVNTAQNAAKDPNVTGIIQMSSYHSIIELAQKFNPKATKIIAIIDNTLTGIGDKNQYYQVQNEFPELTFDDINVSEYNYSELPSIFQKIDNDTIVLYLTMYLDKDKNFFTISEASNFLYEHIKVPIYRASMGGVGEGLLGGPMISFSKSGGIAANMILDVFEGTPIASIDIISKSPTRFLFDYALIKKFNIDMNLVPKGSDFINKKQSFYETNKEFMQTIFLIGIILLALLIILIIDNITRRKMHKQLKYSTSKLSQTYDDLSASEEELRAQYETIQSHLSEIEILNQKYEIAIQSTDSAVFQFDLITGKITISENFRNRINPYIQEQDNINQVMSLLLSPESIRVLKLYYLRFRKDITNDFMIQLPITNFQGKKQWILARGRAVLNDANVPKNLHGILLDITRMKSQEEYITHQAYHDYLTNLPNRKMFLEHMTLDLKKGIPGSILLLDIDNFKEINDTLGHTFGDNVLMEISDRLTSLTSKNINAYRIGGDEFIFVLTNISVVREIEKTISVIRTVLEKPFLLNKTEMFLHFSIGITRFPDDSTDLNQLMMNADTAMYKVKHNGKNNYQFFQETMQEELKGKIEIVTILRDALKNDKFYLMYQPQVDLETGLIISFEALLRLKEHSISPNQFINVAEESDLIIPIGRWVTSEAISMLQRWKEQGLELKPIAINFSSKQLGDNNYLDFLSDKLELADIDPKYIEIEITEGIMFEKKESTLTFLYRLKEMGIQLALDDFGTGYSSLNYLTYIPVHKIKLDKSICDKFLGLKNRGVIDSLISLSHSLELVIAAEGIEEEYQYETLKESGCDFIQGYIFSKPLMEDDIAAIYDKNLVDICLTAKLP